MKIGIDARMYGLENAGIGRYIKNLLTHLFAIDKTNSYTIFLRSRYSRTLKVPKNVTKVTANFAHYSLDEQTKLVRLLNNHKVDLMHFPHFNVPLLYRKPFVVTIHDLLWHKTKGLGVTSLSPFKYAFKYLGYRAVVNHALASSEAILVPSQFVKQEVVHYGGLDRKITVTYEGVDTHLPKVKTGNFAKLAKTWHIKSPFIVYTGSVYPHKNVKRLILAVKHYHEMSHQSLQLVIISSRTIFLDTIRKFVKQHQLGTSVSFTGFLPDSDIKAIYGQAIALVHPSLSEGFGLTGLEAMALGVPVISSHAGSLPEVYGQAALYIDPKNVGDIAGKIKDLIEHPAMRQNLIDSGYRQVAKFDWQATAQTTLGVYQSATKPL
ncbi:hypothetical protein A3B57_04330 [Microgenomates group bacterium RIFCSPLOWO2_01_FULL_47_10]|nr:MAG: hypothetical protein A3B57_04330 [Microgenomates group bacterium RIFCSPLOWO2_01_FULL_47_10]